MIATVKGGERIKIKSMFSLVYCFLSPEQTF